MGSEYLAVDGEADIPGNISWILGRDMGDIAAICVNGEGGQQVCVVFIQISMALILNTGYADAKARQIDH